MAGRLRGNNLCCCEYISDSGEVNHILACCCNCTHLDETCDSILCCKKIPVGSWRRILATVADRIRIPNCDGRGARRLSSSTMNIVISLLFPPVAVLVCCQDLVYILFSCTFFLLPLLLFFASQDCFYLSLSSLIWLLLFMQFVILSELKVLFSEHCVLMLGVSAICMLGLYLPTQLCGASEQVRCSQRRHRSAWLSCCVEKKPLYPVFLICIILTCIFYADLAITSACRSWSPSQPIKDLIVLPYDCSLAYDELKSSISYASGLYAVGVAGTALLSIASYFFGIQSIPSYVSHL